MRQVHLILLIVVATSVILLALFFFPSRKSRPAIHHSGSLFNLGRPLADVTKACVTVLPMVGLDKETCKKFCGLDERRPGKFNAKLPSNATDSLRYFVLFVGHARSGSSFTGAVLDAHPHVILPYEYFLPNRMVVAPELYTNSAFLYSELYRTALWRMGDKNTDFKSGEKGYTLVIKDSYQGKYDRWVSVIGDKSGAFTNWIHMASPERFSEVIHNIEDITNLTVKFIQVVRNPFDIIATTYLYFEGGAELRSALRANPNMTVETDERVLDCVVERHVREVMSLTYLANSQLYSILRVYIEDMVMNPKEEILNLCKFLELECSQDYIDNCAAAIFPSSSKSRYKLQWTQRQSNRVIELINATPYLRYRYPSGF